MASINKHTAIISVIISAAVLTAARCAVAVMTP